MAQNLPEADKHILMKFTRTTTITKTERTIVRIGAKSETAPAPNEVPSVLALPAPEDAQASADDPKAAEPGEDNRRH